MIKSFDMETSKNSSSISDIRLSCNVLKFIACVIMAVDHFGYGVIHNYLKIHGMDIEPETYTVLSDTLEVCRGIGRIAFPIFCFFLVEGFIRTRNVAKYAFRLGLFAVLSEIPFDLGLYGKLFYWKHQNIILTFFMALIMMLILRYLEQNTLSLSHSTVFLAYVCTAVTFAQVSYMIHADYSWKCILLVAVLYLLRASSSFRLVAGAAATSWEKYAPLSFILLYFYDPSVKPRFKYAFYLFYPLHLLAVYLVALLVI